MKRFILLSIALIISLIAKSQNSRIEALNSAPQPVCRFLINGSIDTDLAFLERNLDYKNLLSNPWKLDQMYINEVATVDTAFSNVFLAFEFPSTLIWVRNYNGTNLGKDYPAKFSFGGVAGSTPESCLLSSITTFHKYQTNTIMDTYLIEHLSNKVLILRSNQKDKEDPSRTNTIEYRFVSKP